MALQLLDDGAGNILTDDGSPAIQLDDGVPALPAGPSIAVVSDDVIDFGLAILADFANKIYICNAEPTNFGEVLSFAIGVNDFGAAGGAFGPVSSMASPDLPGRYVASTPVTAGTVLANGSGSHWATVDSLSSPARLLVRGPVDVPQTVTLGATWQLPSFTIRRPR